MTKQLPLLRGIAILAVVCNHAAGRGYTAMFWWVHRYRDVAAPNFDQVGSLPYYGLVVMQQLALFSVPAFLFISGFFIAYAARGSRPTLSWKVVRARVANLLWPYLVWSLVIFVGDALEGKTYAWGRYLGGIVLGRAVGAYFFIPLIIQFYLLSPILVPLAKHRSRILLISLALVQLLVIGLLYYHKFGGQLPSLPDNWPWAPVWWAFYFPLGVVCGFYRTRLKQWLARAKWVLLIAVAAFGILSIFEAEWLYFATGDFDWSHASFKLSSCLYAVAFILSFLAWDTRSVPFARFLNQLGGMSYGIYLLHPKSMEIVARVVYHVAPWLLSQQVLLQPIFIVVSVGVPVLLMGLLARSRFKVSYRYLFG
jgi:peptidoglycan/LPS O-acetylase OafA/YrhL